MSYLKCLIERTANFIVSKFIDYSCILESIKCAIENNNSDDLYTIKQMLAHNNPMTVAGEYPTIEEGRFVVSAPYTRFLDMLNTDMFVIFKIDNNNYDFPIYFKDSVGYEHRVVLPDSTPVLVNQLLLNGIYSAKYQYNGGYIILNDLTPLNPDVI